MSCLISQFQITHPQMYGKESHQTNPSKNKFLNSDARGEEEWKFF